MNKSLDRVLLARPLLLTLGGGASALVNPSLQSGSLLSWIIVIFGGATLVVWATRNRRALRPVAPQLSASVGLLGWAVLATFTGGLESPFVAAFFFEIVLAVVSMGPRGVFWVTANAAILLVGVELLYGFAQGWLLALEIVFVAAIGGLGATLSWRRQSGEVALRTQGEELSQRLESLQRELEDERVISRVGENVARLAHGLKNAVHSLRGFVSLIEPRLERGAGTNAALAGLHAAIDDLEKLARMTLDETAEARPPEVAPAEPTTSVPRPGGGVEADVSEIVAAARRELESASPEVTWRVVEGEAARALRVAIAAPTLLELLVILMRNAVEAMDGRGRAELAYGAEGPVGRVSIRDEGPGFAHEDLEKIFQPGYTTKTQGSGFGLFLARRIVEDHGGRLALENGPDGGAVVWVELPRCDAAASGLGD